MRTIKQYGILTANSPGELAGAVNQYIGEGWQPYGPPMMVRIQSESGEQMGAMQQAVVRYEQLISGAIQ